MLDPVLICFNLVLTLNIGIVACLCDVVACPCGGVVCICDVVVCLCGDIVCLCAVVVFLCNIHNLDSDPKTKRATRKNANDFIQHVHGLHAS